jgi:formate dehydrogenase major subunit
MPSIAGISWQRLEREGAVTYPCADEAASGERVVFTERFSTADGLARLVPAQFIPADELPDREFPLVLITGRQLEHWHTGAMTRRASHLHALEPTATASLHPSVLAGLGLHAGDSVTVSSRRGSITLAVRADEAVQADCVFIPFAYAEAAANLLTNDALDPFGKIAEVKYCAVKIEAKHAAHSALLEQQLQP